MWGHLWFVWFLLLAVLCRVSIELCRWCLMTPDADSTPSVSLLLCLTTNSVVICTSVDVGGLGQILESLKVNPGKTWAVSVAQNIFVTSVTCDGIVQRGWTASQQSGRMSGLLSSYILYIYVLDEGTYVDRYASVAAPHWAVLLSVWVHLLTNSQLSIDCML